MADINYLQIMTESLQNKSSILSRILDKTSEIHQIATQQELDETTFDRKIEDISKLIAELDLLDSGFDSVYERVREELLYNRKAYEKEIRTLQDLIREITDKSIRIQNMEQENKTLLEKHFLNQKKKIRDTKKSKQVARDYYNNMSQLNYTAAQFLDHKK